jgi:nucleolin
VKATNKVPQPKGKGKVVESSSDDDSDDSDEDDKKKKPVVGQKRPRATSAASDASTGKKAATQKQAKVGAQKAVKKAESSDDSSDSEEEVKPVRKGSIQKKAAPAKKAKDSSDESSDDDVKVIAPKGGKKAAPAKKAVDSDESSDESSEDEAPKKAVRKQSNVSQKSNSKKQTKKANPESDDEEAKGGNASGPSELFVGNMAFTTSEDALREQFEQHGEVTNIKILTQGPGGRSKGCAFVQFANAADAQKALDAENGNTLEGRELKVNFSSGGAPKGEGQQRSFSQGPRGGDAGGESTTLFVGNLGFRTDQRGLSNFFSKCGPIKDVRIAMGEDGRPKGFAHVEFESTDAAKSALDLNG